MVREGGRDEGQRLALREECIPRIDRGLRRLESLEWVLHELSFQHIGSLVVGVGLLPPQHVGS